MEEMEQKIKGAENHLQWLKQCAELSIRNTLKKYSQSTSFPTNDTSTGGNELVGDLSIVDFSLPLIWKELPRKKNTERFYFFCVVIISDHHYTSSLCESSPTQPEVFFRLISIKNINLNSEIRIIVYFTVFRNSAASEFSHRKKHNKLFSQAAEFFPLCRASISPSFLAKHSSPMCELNFVMDDYLAEVKNSISNGSKMHSESGSNQSSCCLSFVNCHQEWNFGCCIILCRPGNCPTTSEFFGSFLIGDTRCQKLQFTSEGIGFYDTSIHGTCFQIISIPTNNIQLTEPKDQNSLTIHIKVERHEDVICEFQGKEDIDDFTTYIRLAKKYAEKLGNRIILAPQIQFASQTAQEMISDPQNMAILLKNFLLQ